MLPKKISQSFALNLMRLMDGEAVKASAFNNKRQLKKLEDDRILSRMVSGRNRATFRCNDPEALRNYLQLHFGITNLEAYIELLNQKDRDGENSLQATTSTKAFRSQGMQGFFIKSFGSTVSINGQALDALPDGVEYFVHHPDSLQISPTALVVGIENPECFVKIDRLMELLPKGDLVFVMRYHSLSPVKWLQSSQNHYLHFGDFDPAGIAIYCNEYLSRLGSDRCRFFVPSGIEAMIKENGQIELYDRQQQQWPPKVKIMQPELAALIAVIDQCGKGLEQEWLLRC